MITRRSIIAAPFVIIPGMALAQRRWGKFQDFGASGAVSKVVFDANTTAAVSTTGGTSITNNNLTIGTGSNRALVVFFLTETLEYPITGGALSWDAVDIPVTGGAEIAVSGGNITSRIFMWGLLNPNSGNKTLLFNWTNAHNAWLWAMSFTGVNQTNNATAFTNSIQATGTSAAPTETITSATSDIATGAFICNADGFTSMSPIQMAINAIAPNPSWGIARNEYSASAVISGVINSSQQWDGCGVNIKAA